MPALRNDKWELFAQGLAKGLTAEEAYSEAGYKPNRHNASRLKTNENVLRRVAELKDRSAKRVAVTVESLCMELEEARGIAISERQSSAAVSATMGKAKLFGLGVENRRLSGTVKVVTITAKDLEKLDPDELALLEEAYPVLEKLGITGGDIGGEETPGG